MDKEQVLAAITAGQHLVLYWNDTTARWAFYEASSFIDEVLYRQYRELGKQITQVQKQLNPQQATALMEERIRLIHDRLEAACRETGIAFLHTEDAQEIFGFWLVVPATRDWARRVAETRPWMPSIHEHRKQPNITILPDRNAN